MKKDSTPTLRDVARSSGVSVTTVSRILNGRETGVAVRPDTRERIVAAAKALGYKPNLLARGLRGSPSSLLGVIARDISDPFHIQILRGINELSRTRGYRMFLGHVDYRPEEAVQYSSMFEYSHADGIIVIGDFEDPDPTLDVLVEQHRYVVGVTDRTSRRTVPGVYADSAEGTELALDHLWGLGHRAITCVSNDSTADGRLRVERYKAFLADRGADEHIRVFITDHEPAHSYELGKRIFGPDVSPPTAIYATCDTTAIGLMQAAYQAGRSIPGELSIVGYDDIDLAAFTIPPLTTISQSGLAMGRAAAELLFTMIEQGLDRNAVDDVVLPTSLVVRESTAAPR